jgi:O-antigen ligase
VRIATGDWLIATGIAGAWLACALLAGGYFRATTVPLAALAISALALVGSVRRLRRPSVVVLALLFLATWTAASGLWGPADSLSVASLPILYAATLWLAEQGDGRASLHALRIAILMITGLALAARALTLAPMAGGSSTRLEWPVTYANGLGLIAATGVLLWAGLPTGRVYLGHAAIAVCLTTTCLTFSRSAIIGLAAALLLLLAGRRRLSRRATVTAVVAALLSCAILGPALWARFAAPAPDARDVRRVADISGHGRAQLWQAAWRDGLAHPLVGSGAGSFEARHGTAAAHSLELQTFAELGVVGVTALTLFFAGALAITRRHSTAVSVFALWMIVSAVDWDWQLPAATLPAIIVVAAGIRRPSRSLRSRHLQPHTVGRPQLSTAFPAKR